MACSRPGPLAAHAFPSVSEEVQAQSGDLTLQIASGFYLSSRQEGAPKNPSSGSQMGPLLRTHTGKTRLYALGDRPILLL
jgi:hypothetical protein